MGARVERPTRQDDQKKDADVSDPDFPSFGQLLAVVWPAYGVLGFSSFVSWQLGSEPALISIAILAAALGGVLGGVGVLRATSPLIDFEARAHGHQPLKARRSARHTLHCNLSSPMGQPVGNQRESNPGDDRSIDPIIP